MQANPARSRSPCAQKDSSQGGPPLDWAALRLQIDRDATPYEGARASPAGETCRQPREHIGRFKNELLIIISIKTELASTLLA